MHERLGQLIYWVAYAIALVSVASSALAGLVHGELYRFVWGASFGIGVWLTGRAALYALAGR
jgi:hypothetical protein